MVEFGGSFGDYGQGSYIRSVPKRQAIHFQNFSGGYFSAINRKEVPENTSPFAIDFEVTKHNRLRRSPGTALLELFPGHEPYKFVVHGSLDFTAELVFFDPPYLGIKRLGDTEWDNKGFIDNNRWFAWTNFGGTLIFSDGEAVYARQVNDGTTTSVVTDAPVAVTYESWAGRVWAGGAIIDENFEQLGLVWSAANSDYTDWLGIGAGFELLIDAISAGDRFIRLKSMGLDFMAVLMRKSIWIVRRTGQADRPGDPQPRVAGKGAVNHDVVQSTNKGIVYLCDDGVELFDGNNSEKISLAIDGDLLPLDYGAILEYSSSYDSIRNRYYLHDPRGTTWIYDVTFNRWFRRSLSAYASGEWPLQAEGMLVEGAPRMVFLGDQVDESIAPRALAEEDQDSEENFGAPLTPIWTTRPLAKELINELLTTQLFNIEYEGAGDLELWSPDNSGNYDLLVTESLIPKSDLDVVDIRAPKTGRLAGLMLRLSAGDIEISDIQAVVQDRGPRVALGEEGEIGNFPDRTTLLDFPIGQAWYSQGGIGGPATPAWAITVTPGDDYLYTLLLGGDDEAEVEPTEYVWDFGDDTTESTAVPTVDHTYAPGSYEPSVEIFVNGWSMGRYLYGPLEVEEEVEPVETSYFPIVGAGPGASDFKMTITSGAFGDADAAFADAKVPTINTPASQELADGFLELSFNESFGQWDCSMERPVFRFDMTGFVAPAESGVVKLTVYSMDDWGGTLPEGTIPNQFVQLMILNRPSPLAVPEEADWARIDAADLKASETIFASIALSNLETIEFPLNVAGLAHAEAGGAFVLRYSSDIQDNCPNDLVDSDYLMIDFYSMDDESWAADFVAPELVMVTQ